MSGKFKEFPKNHAITTRLDDRDLRLLHLAARKAKVSRTEYIREVLRQHLHTEREIESLAG